MILLSSSYIVWNHIVWVPESWIDPKFPVIPNFKRSFEEFFVCWEKANEDDSVKQVCRCFIWVTDLGTIHVEVLPNCFLPRQTIKVEAFYNGGLFPKNITQSQPKISYKPADFRQILQYTCAVYLLERDHLTTFHIRRDERWTLIQIGHHDITFTFCKCVNVKIFQFDFFSAARPKLFSS